MTDISESLPADAPDSPEAPSLPSRRRRLAVALGLFAVVATAAAFFFLPTPWYLYEPGSVRVTQPRIGIEDHQAFDADGSIYYPTVGTRRATPATLLQAALDDRVDVMSEEEVYPSGDRDQERVVNRQLMEDSKLYATVAAFDRVGYPVEVVGTGAFVDDLAEGFPAAAVLRQGDVITAVDDQPVRLAADLRPLIQDRPVGSPVELALRRPGVEEPVRVTATLGEHPEEPGRGFLGVAVSTADQDLRLPFEVDIDSGRVLGPSGGLAWTLGIIDRLTPGDLAGGRRVVATGEIRPDGTVGTVGGVEQKMASVVRGDFDVFLFPADTPAEVVAELEDMSGGRVELHPVADVDDAVAILAPSGLPPAPPLS